MEEHHFDQCSDLLDEMEGVIRRLETWLTGPLNCAIITAMLYESSPIRTLTMQLLERVSYAGKSITSVCISINSEKQIR